MSQQSQGNRWLIAIMGTVLQMVLGTVYAWSFFQKPIVTQFGWTNVQAMWIFSLAICTLGLAAAWGGMNLPKHGPKKLATLGVILYGAGYVIGALAMSMKSLPIFYLGYGVVGGIGLGLGYVTPVATAAKWFPDKKGFVTGMVVMGFGFGALVMSKVIAPVIMAAVDNQIVPSFAWIGVVLFVIGLPAALAMKNPPAGFVPAGWTPPAQSAASKLSEDSLTARQALLSGKFVMMWLILFFNVTAGIMFIGMQSPMLQDILRKINPTMTVAALASAGATLIAISSLFNGIGRFFWGGLSDKIGRAQTFRLILGTQVLVFAALIFVGNPWIFGILVCYVLLCYGGGFGTMPSFVLDIFGARLMPVVYGTILTAWSAGGIAGPQIAAAIKDARPESAGPATFTVGAIILVVGLIIAFLTNNKAMADKS
ncbi:MAG: OFA family MFS transporter [Candidatus Krumholzibacteria bacterium]|nr:OFA family MFS transporter [Candidatus Krumholzibacteria bacterium]